MTSIIFLTVIGSIKSLIVESLGEGVIRGAMDQGAKLKLAGNATFILYSRSHVLVHHVADLRTTSRITPQL